MKQESQFGMSPEKVEALRNTQREDQREAGPDVFDKLVKLAAGEEEGILGKGITEHYLAEHARHETINLNIDKEFVRRAFYELRDATIEKDLLPGCGKDEECRTLKEISLNIDGSDCLIQFSTDEKDKDFVTINIFVSSEVPTKPIEEVDYITLKSDGTAWTGRNILDDEPRTSKELERKKEMVKNLPPDFFEKFIESVLEKARQL